MISEDRAPPAWRGRSVEITITAAWVNRDAVAGSIPVVSTMPYIGAASTMGAHDICSRSFERAKSTRAVAAGGHDGRGWSEGKA